MKSAEFAKVAVFCTNLDLALFGLVIKRHVIKNFQKKGSFVKKQKIMSLSGLVMPVSVQAAAVASKPMALWVFVAVAPVMMMNKPTSLFGLMVFLLAVALEALIISRVAHVAYRSCLKRMVTAKIISLLVNALVFLIGVFVAMMSNYDLINMINQKGAALSMEQKMVLRSKFMWMILLLFTIMCLVKMLIEYVAFRRFGLSVQRGVLIKALLLASGVSYGIMMLMLLISEYFKVDLSVL